MSLTEQEKFNSICYKFQTGSILLEETILQLCGGDVYDWLTLTLIIYIC